VGQEPARRDERCKRQVRPSGSWRTSRWPWPERVTKNRQTVGTSAGWRRPRWRGHQLQTDATVGGTHRLGGSQRSKSIENFLSLTLFEGAPRTGRARRSALLAGKAQKGRQGGSANGRRRVCRVCSPRAESPQICPPRKFASRRWPPRRSLAHSRAKKNNLKYHLLRQPCLVVGYCACTAWLPSKRPRHHTRTWAAAGSSRGARRRRVVADPRGPRGPPKVRADAISYSRALPAEGGAGGPREAWVSAVRGSSRSRPSCGRRPRDQGSRCKRRVGALCCWGGARALTRTRGGSRTPFSRSGRSSTSASGTP